jgi:hypothetical protein
MEELLIEVDLLHLLIVHHHQAMLLHHILHLLDMDL